MYFHPDVGFAQLLSSQYSRVLCRLINVPPPTSPQGVREPIQPPDNSRSVANIREAMMAWSVDLRGPQKMVVPLEDYFIMGKRLPFETIRDFDRAKVEAFLHSSQVRFA